MAEKERNKLEIARNQTSQQPTPVLTFWACSEHLVSEHAKGLVRKPFVCETCSKRHKELKQWSQCQKAHTRSGDTHHTHHTHYQTHDHDTVHSPADQEYRLLHAVVDSLKLGKLASESGMQDAVLCIQTANKYLGQFHWAAVLSDAQAMMSNPAAGNIEPRSPGGSRAVSVGPVGLPPSPHSGMGPATAAYARGPPHESHPYMGPGGVTYSGPGGYAHQNSPSPAGFSSRSYSGPSGAALRGPVLRSHPSPFGTP